MMYLFFWGQNIHLSDFPKKNTPKMPTYFFFNENGEGV